MNIYIMRVASYSKVDASEQRDTGMVNFNSGARGKKDRNLRTEVECASIVLMSDVFLPRHGARPFHHIRPP